MASVRFDTDFAAAIAAHEDLADAIADVNEEYEETAKGARKLERAAGRIVQANLTAQERYNQKMAELARLVKAGKLSMDEAEKAALRYRRQLERAQNAGKRAFGPDMLQGVRNIAAGYLSVQTAVQAVTAAINENAARQEQAAQQARASRAGLAELAQLAATSEKPEEAYAALVKEARDFRAQGAAENVDEAARELFSLVSAGLERRDRDFAAQLRASGVLTEVGGSATAFSALTTALGAGEVGSFEEMISKALAASSIAPALANEIVQASAASGGSASSLGVSDEFLLSATAILGKKTGTAAQGGTQLAALLKGLEEKTGDEFKGKGGLEIVRELAGRNLDRAGIVDLVGNRAEAVEGVRTLVANIEMLEKVFSEVQAAPGQNKARLAIGLPDTDAQLAAARQADRAAAARDVFDQATKGDLKNLVTAAQDELATTRTGYFAEFKNILEGMNIWQRQALEGEAGSIALLEQALETQQLSNELSERIVAALENHGVQLEGINRNTASNSTRGE